MKYLLLVLFLSFFICGFGQKKANLANDSTKLALKNELRKMDSVSKVIKQKEAILDKKLNDASQTIGYLDSLINSFGQIFTILGIYIGLISLIAPILVYQFGIKPSQRALKDLETNFDKRLADYLRNTRNSEIDKAIDNIQNGTVEKLHQALSFLSLTQHEGFSDVQLYRIFSTLKKAADLNTRSQLAFILSTIRNEYAETFFSVETMTADPVLKQMGYLYFAKTGFAHHVNKLKDIFNLSAPNTQEYLYFLSHLAQYSFNHTIDYFNDENLIDNLHPSILSDIKINIPTYLTSLSIPEQKYQETYLFRKLQSI